MSRSGVIVSTIVVAVVIIPVLAPGAVMDFESPAVGTTYGGSAGDSPGDVVLTEDGIDMSVEEFTVGAFTGFMIAEIGGVTDPDFATTPLSINNIAVQFDLTGLGFLADEVTLEYIDYGGTENIEVNGAGKHEVNFLSNAPAAIAPGVVLTVIENPFAFGVEGTIHLSGPVDSLLIGGQEFGIDNVTATPEPTTLLLLCAGIGLLRHRRNTVRQGER